MMYFIQRRQGEKCTLVCWVVWPPYIIVYIRPNCHSFAITGVFVLIPLLAHLPKLGGPISKTAFGTCTSRVPASSEWTRTGEKSPLQYRRRTPYGHEGRYCVVTWHYRYTIGQIGTRSTGRWRTHFVEVEVSRLREADLFMNMANDAVQAVKMSRLTGKKFS